MEKKNIQKHVYLTENSHQKLSRLSETLGISYSGAVNYVLKNSRLKNLS